MRVEITASNHGGSLAFARALPRRVWMRQLSGRAASVPGPLSAWTVTESAVH